MHLTTKTVPRNQTSMSQHHFATNKKVEEYISNSSLLKAISIFSGSKQLG
uniref:Uncharacterized protein n=1 Tax=Arundo donax TaxID=35708 RepID=A0A0A9AR32_ARUDO